MEMENANLCFSTYETPWRTASHKCTHFNIINIIWLPLYHPHSPGFYLPVAAGGEMENRFHSISSGRRSRMMAGGDMRHRAVSPLPYHLHSLGTGRQGPQARRHCPASVSPRARTRMKAGALATWLLPPPLVGLFGVCAPSDCLGAPSGQGRLF